MADGGARVGDLDAIRTYRAAVVRFIESVTSALTDADSEITRRIAWCEGEQSAFWQHNIRKLQELIGQLKEAIRMKKLFKDSSGRTQSAFDEEKKLRAAQQKLEHAEQRLANCRKWAKQLQREHLMYRGGVQRLQTAVGSDLVNAVAMLDQVTARLDAYINAAAPGLAASEAAGLSPTPDVPAGQMKRAADADVPRVDGDPPDDATEDR